MLSIGKIAKLANVTTDAIRYYEKEGLIEPDQRSESGYRLYSPEVIKKIKFIKHAQHSGFTLNEIKELLEFKNTDTACCSDVRSLTIHKQLQIKNKIKLLEEISSSLGELINVCKDGDKKVDECPILAAFERLNHD